MRWRETGPGRIESDAICGIYGIVSQTSDGYAARIYSTERDYSLIAHVEHATRGDAMHAVKAAVQRAINDDATRTYHGQLVNAWNLARRRDDAA